MYVVFFYAQILKFMHVESYPVTYFLIANFRNLNDTVIELLSQKQAFCYKIR